ncbi:hypothetical protein [Halorussus lipolyticus]|uniref:hypothetical protein n=1 Tax=Halorussus lipolyticus TaxID=3034024 RepID=UPI0023E85CDC|nr:hypothetical protein [Halorussus sp. DT80]
MPDVSDAIDSSRSGQDEDTTQGNWLTRNFWMVKGLVAVALLVGLAYGSLAVFDHELANVLWAISITMAGLVVLIQVGFGALRVVRSA